MPQLINKATRGKVPILHKQKQAEAFHNTLTTTRRILKTVRRGAFNTRRFIRSL